LERFLTLIKIFNVVAGILIIVGVVTLVWLLVQRGTGSSGQVGSALQSAIPVDGRIAEMIAAGDHALLLLETPEGGQTLLILNPNRPAGLATIRVGEAAAAAPAP